MYAVKVDILKGTIETFFNINKYSVTHKGDIITDNMGSIDLSYFTESVKPKYKDLLNRIQELMEILSEDVPEKRDLFDQILFSKKFDDLNKVVDESERQYQEITSEREAMNKELEELLSQKEEYELDEWANLFNIIDSQSVKYISSICLLAKDEDRYLDEWIMYHIGIGIDHIFIYDNGS